MRAVKLFSAAVAFMFLLAAKGYSQDHRQNDWQHNDDRERIEDRVTKQVNRMKTQLSLTDDQYNSIYKLLVSSIKEQESLWSSGKSHETINSEMRKNEENIQTQMKSILTADQYAKYNKNRDDDGDRDDESDGRRNDSDNHHHRDNDR